jgi:arabinan endo-1,5-alpha-L-arabinosidase
VRELLPTADGWLTAAPYEYRGSAAVPPTAANTSDPTVGDDDDGFGDYIVAPSSAPNLAARLCHCVRPVHESDLAHPSLVSGDYEFVRHDPHAYFNGTRNADGTWHGVNLPETITLQPDGRVTSGGVVDFFDTPDANLPRSTDGPVSRGSWRMLGATPAGVHCCDSDMAITIDGMTYTGVFAVLPRETDGRATLTFSAIGGNQAIWGARIEG